ncbi:MAG: nucleotide disphospho-sugar-binding domain-containing protein [Bacteroidota bacterium]
MKISLCTIGSRGDIQPFLTLGEYLSNSGHEVKVSSAKMYQSLAEKYDVAYEYFEGDFESIIDDEALKKEIGKNPFTINKQLKEKVYAIIENSLETFYDLLQWSDVVVYHPKTLIDSIGYESQEKLIKGYVVPAFTPTSQFLNPIFSSFYVPRFLNRLSFKFANAMIGTMKTPIANFKKKRNLDKSPSLLDTTTVYGVSPSIIDLPSDYTSNHHFTGFWHKEEMKDNLSEDIVEFMSGEQQVLIITFGSMPYKSNIDINLIIKSLQQEYGIKILIVKAWGLKDTTIEESETVKAIDAAPFDVLFPLADYVIHHGGAGTTATALRAGIPQLICPVLYPVDDQFFWGTALNKKGVSPAPIPLKKLSIEKLKKAFVQMMKKEGAR